MVRKDFLAAHIVLALFVSVSADLAFGKDDRFRCRANGQGGREADLRMEDGRFRAKWEINLNQGQFPGTVVAVTIANVPIGEIVLEQNGGQLEGEIQFRGNNFPSEFPQIRSGTPVTIGSLSCRFAKD